MNCKTLKMKLVLLTLIASGHLFGAVPQSECPATALADIGLCFTATTTGTSPNQQGINGTPDTDGAVGPTQFVMAVNPGIRSFDKKTGLPDGVLNVGLPCMFDDRGFVDNTDPEILYDAATHRWFIVAIDRGAAGDRRNNSILLAISDGENEGTITPVTKWATYSFQHNLIPEGKGPNTRSGCGCLGQGGDDGLFLDYPKLAIDTHAVYVGANMQTSTGSVFINSTIYVFNKESLLSGDQSNVKVKAYRKLLGSGPFPPSVTAPTIHPALNFDKNPKFGYAMGVYPGTISDPASSFLNFAFYRIENPGSDTPVMSDQIVIPIPVTAAVPVPEFGGAPHKGNVIPTNDRNLIETFDTRLITDHVRNNHFFAVQTIFVNKKGTSDPVDGTLDRAAIRWYEFDLASQAPSILQIGTIFDTDQFTSTPLYYYMPSIMSNKRGDIFVGSSVSGANAFIDAVGFRRFKGDPKGFPELNGIANSLMRDPIKFSNSQTSYNLQFTTTGPQRWGDYSYTSLDPIDKMTMWTIQEFCADTDVWGCQVIEIKAPAVIPPFPQP